MRRRVSVYFAEEEISSNILRVARNVLRGHRGFGGVFGAGFCGQTKFSTKIVDSICQLLSVGSIVAV